MSIVFNTFFTTYIMLVIEIKSINQLINQKLTFLIQLLYFCIKLCSPYFGPFTDVSQSSCRPFVNFKAYTYSLH